MAKNLTKRSEDYSKWYNELVISADLAENSGVRGCMHPLTPEFSAKSALITSSLYHFE